jgi:hypothetical protein
MRYLCLTTALAAMSWFGPQAAGGDYAPKVGSPHPDFTLPNLEDGRPVSLSQFRGKKVLLIHFASW